MQEQEEEKKIVRNLKKDETKKVILAFLKNIEPITVNGKKLVLHTSPKSITTNPELSIGEIQQTLGVIDKTKLDFFRQLYVRSANKVIKELFPEDDILNLPIVSFEEHQHIIKLTY
jgi:hypothetical protein